MMVFAGMAGALAATAGVVRARTGPNPVSRWVLPVSSGVLRVADSEGLTGSPVQHRSNGAAPVLGDGPPGGGGAGPAGVGALGSGPSPPGTDPLVRRNTAGTIITGTASSTEPQVMAVPVPLPDGAVQLDSTYYDLQDMGSLGTRILVGPDGRVHVVWQDDNCDYAGLCPPNLGAPEPYPQRSMSYAWRDLAGQWHHNGRVDDPRLRQGCCVPELNGGFGTIALTPDDRIAIAEHMREDGCDLRGDFYLQDTPGGTTYRGYLTPIVDPSFLFPQVAALPNGSFVLMGERPLTPPEHFYEEVREFDVSTLSAAGGTFVCPTGWQCGPWTPVVSSSLFRDGFPAYPCLASARDGRAGIAVTDFGGNVLLIESTDGTFHTGTVRIRNLTNYYDTAITKSDSTSQEYRPNIHCHLAYQDTTPHVVWAELQARRSGTSIVYVDWRSRIRHWSSTGGLSTVKQVSPGEADHYDDIDNGLAGPICGFNTISVDWPQVGFSPDGQETYVAWDRFTDAAIDPTADSGLPGVVTGVGFGDIAASVQRNGGPWSAPQNLTNTPNTDERFFSLAALDEAGTLRLVFQASATNQAGCVVIGDRGSSPGNLVRRIAYLERRLTSSTVSVDDPAARTPALISFPNPARGRITFSADPARARGDALLVFSVSGRRVARIPMGSGSVSWDGRDDAGHAVASGLYFARPEGDRAAPGTKFMWLR